MVLLVVKKGFRFPLERLIMERAHRKLQRINTPGIREGFSLSLLLFTFSLKKASLRCGHNCGIHWQGQTMVTRMISSQF